MFQTVADYFAVEFPEWNDGNLAWTSLGEGYKKRGKRVIKIFVRFMETHPPQDANLTVEHFLAFLSYRVLGEPLRRDYPDVLYRCGHPSGTEDISAHVWFRMCADNALRPQWARFTVCLFEIGPTCDSRYALSRTSRGCRWNSGGPMESDINSRNTAPAGPSGGENVVRCEF